MQRNIITFGILIAENSAVRKDEAIQISNLVRRGGIMSEYMMTVKEMAEVLEVSERTGYKIIKQLNDELNAKGYMTQVGRVSRKYFYERLGLEYSCESGKK